MIWQTGRAAQIFEAGNAGDFGFRYTQRADNERLDQAEGIGQFVLVGEGGALMGAGLAAMNHTAIVGTDDDQVAGNGDRVAEAIAVARRAGTAGHGTDGELGAAAAPIPFTARKDISRAAARVIPRRAHHGKVAGNIDGVTKLRAAATGCQGLIKAPGCAGFEIEIHRPRSSVGLRRADQQRIAINGHGIAVLAQARQLLGLRPGQAAAGEEVGGIPRRRADHGGIHIHIHSGAEGLRPGAGEISSAEFGALDPGAAGALEDVSGSLTAARAGCAHQQGVAGQGQGSAELIILLDIERLEFGLQAPGLGGIAVAGEDVDRAAVVIIARADRHAAAADRDIRAKLGGGGFGVRQGGRIIPGFATAAEIVEFAARQGTRHDMPFADGGQAVSKL